MVSKNRLFIIVCLSSSGFNLMAKEKSWSDWLPSSPISWGTEATNDWILKPLGEANAGTQLAIVAGSLVGWTLYRWIYLKRPSWASLIPDKMRRFGNAILEGFGLGMGRNKALHDEQEAQRKRESHAYKNAYANYHQSSQNPQYNQPPQQLNNLGGQNLHLNIGGGY